MTFSANHRFPKWAMAVAALVLAVAAYWIVYGFPADSNPTSESDTISVAVAGNFSDAATALAARFQSESHIPVRLSFGSTGKLYAQIKNGAPYDVFFAADARRPRLLDQEGLCVADTRTSYAVGKLALWSAKADFVDKDGQILKTGDFRHIAIANPRFAPYGVAAEQVLKSMKLWDDLQPKIVLGENITQTYQFVQTGNAELGFVALSYLEKPDQSAGGSSWMVPQSLYQSIVQQAVVLKDTDKARKFMQFTRGAEGAEIIRRYGYDVP